MAGLHNSKPNIRTSLPYFVTLNLVQGLVYFCNVIFITVAVMRSNFWH